MGGTFNQANAAALFQMQAADMQMRQRMYSGCGCNPSPWQPYGPGPFGPYGGYNSGHGNLPYAQVGNHGFFGLQPTEGYGLDLNNNGRYDRGQDGVLAFDLNRDGRVTPAEIEQSRERLNSFGGNFDHDGDGRVSFCERMRGQGQQRQMQQLDLDGDGRLSAYELARGGGRVLVDGNRDGKFQPWEQHSPFNFPTPGFGRGSINQVDPFWGGTSVHNTGGWGPYRPYY